MVMEIDPQTLVALISLDPLLILAVHPIALSLSLQPPQQATVEAFYLHSQGGASQILLICKEGAVWPDHHHPRH